MTTKIGLAGSEVAVADPDAENYEIEQVIIGASERTLNATLKTHTAGYKKRWHVGWKGLSTAQASAITTELDRKSNLSWYPPEGSNYTVQMINGYRKQPMLTTSSWQIETVLEQV